MVEWTNYSGYKSIKEYCKEKQVSRQTVYNWIASGKLETAYLMGRTLVKEVKK